MKQIAILSALLFSLIITGCAIGPLAGHETAHTVGKSNHEVIGGVGQAGFFAKRDYGIKKDLDFGLHLELLSVGVRAKYAFINGAEKGFSLATAAGIGESLGGEHYYGEILGSYMFGLFEPYTTFRFARVKTDPVKFSNKNISEADFTIHSYRFNYGQIIYGTRVWLSPHWLISAEGETFFVTSSGLRLVKWTLFSASLGYRF